MTPHTHTKYVKGCYRCDLSLDEVRRAEQDTNDLLASVMRKILSRGGNEVDANDVLFYNEDAVGLTEDEASAVSWTIEETK